MLEFFRHTLLTRVFGLIPISIHQTGVLSIRERPQGYMESDHHTVTDTGLKSSSYSKDQAATNGYSLGSNQRFHF